MTTAKRFLIELTKIIPELKNLNILELELRLTPKTVTLYTKQVVTDIKSPVAEVYFTLEELKANHD